ncbi:expressed unknown protein [Ectocarpus siliculosus]|uniref:Uncharacterized protein n=1 Tax=Ectocarpus siliculosus TaxID=2880 RepID=D8LQQ3_ECTSI|nr:expressed unknown protein [Ectocarpus siliculosus]|eukprot:CBN74930.1 expressed unknown protein [Ectocarpus siliculosus]
MVLEGNLPLLEFFWPMELKSLKLEYQADDMEDGEEGLTVLMLRNRTAFEKLAGHSPNDEKPSGAKILNLDKCKQRDIHATRSLPIGGYGFDRPYAVTIARECRHSLAPHVYATVRYW